MTLERLGCLVVLLGCSLSATPPLTADSLVSDAVRVPHRGVWQVTLKATDAASNPFFDVDLQLRFTRPDGSNVTVDAFFRGDDSWVGRAYCDQLGRWFWRSSSKLPSLDGRSGTFEVRPSELPGKLRKHGSDPFQFARDDGSWFLHVGDTGYAFVDAPWSDVITLEDIDQVHGEVIAKFREIGSDPIVNDEDRYELYRGAGNKRYFFRRLMWGSLLSGGHATYGGLKTYEAHDGGPERGVRGYFDANRDGTLSQGAHDFPHIHRFFRESRLTMVGLEPDDAFVGGNPLRAKCARNDSTILVYLANPTGTKPEQDNPAVGKPVVAMALPEGRYTVRWFNPRTGSWTDSGSIKGGARRKLSAPAAKRTLAGDWVLLLRRIALVPPE